MRKHSDPMEPEDAIDAMQYFARRIIDFDAKQNTVERRKHYDTYIEYLTDLDNYAWNKKIRLRSPELTGIPLEDIAMIVIFCSNLFETLERQKHLSKYGIKPRLGGQKGVHRPLAWEQEDTDHHIIQRMINQLREIIQSTITMQESQQLRMLKRLEAFQSALHKRKPRFKVIDLLFDSD